MLSLCGSLFRDVLFGLVLASFGCFVVSFRVSHVLCFMFACVVVSCFIFRFVGLLLVRVLFWFGCCMCVLLCLCVYFRVFVLRLFGDCVVVVALLLWRRVCVGLLLFGLLCFVVLVSHSVSLFRLFLVVLCCFV